MRHFAIRRCPVSVSLLLLVGVVSLLACALPYGNLCVPGDDDLSNDNLWDFNRSLPDGLTAIPVDPYTLPSPGCAGHFVFHRHETPIATWVVPVRFARSPPSIGCD